jgi:hypothetical protein
MSERCWSERGRGMVYYAEYVPGQLADPDPAAGRLYHTDPEHPGFVREVERPWTAPARKVDPLTGRTVPHVEGDFSRAQLDAVDRLFKGWVTSLG